MPDYKEGNFQEPMPRPDSEEELKEKELLEEIPLMEGSILVVHDESDLDEYRGDLPDGYHFEYLRDSPTEFLKYLYIVKKDEVGKEYRLGK
jgi:hypothetical protein